ncbi:M23 family metallopeptidase [uncultured Desulfosarcina sp.]|uniref:M23 family metallopeptidase n=1 Tax=uncultured Desulfosarcina sp. TaxID=218289 RepID=UPI0029C6E329|nr:M23 family metallopeptidase [uncultured Desulfosarcina sp.]
MQRIIIGTILAVLCLPFSAQAFTLEGHLVQGGMAIGKVEPATTVYFHGKAIRVSPEGLFVIGFSRNAEPEAVIELHLPSGTVEKHPVRIEKRSYKIQRIDGLPPRKVTPSAEDLERIRKDIALVKEVRKKDDPRTDFSQPFIWPVTGRISGVYGSQRILNGKPKRPHYGVDIAAPTGTPVKAPIDGVVSLAHDDMFYSGGTLIVDHGHGLSTVFMHLHKILVKEGQRVKQGDVIAQVGATGRVTGPHLHWGMNWFETRLDPSLLVPPMPEATAAAQ